MANPRIHRVAADSMLDLAEAEWADSDLNGSPLVVLQQGWHLVAGPLSKRAGDRPVAWLVGTVWAADVHNELAPSVRAAETSGPFAVRSP
jgi:hypothetical protein